MKPNGWEKKSLSNSFKLDVPKRKKLFPRKRENGSPNHVPLGRKGPTF
jgi:hypothetical protein